MKKIIGVFFAVIFIVVNLSIIIRADNSILHTVNKRIREIYGLEHDYFPESIVVNGQVCNFYYEGRQKEIDDYGYLIYPITYAPAGFGNNEIININPSCYCENGGSVGWGHWSASYHFHKGSFCPDYETRYVGYDKFGSVVIPYFNSDRSRNYGFLKWTYGVHDKTTGLSSPSSLIRYNDHSLLTWANKPGNTTLTPDEKDALIGAMFCKSGLLELDPSGTIIPLLEAAIQKGIDEIYSGVTKDDLENYAGRTPTLVIHQEGQKPACDWSDALLITVPPTDISWGYALRFNDSTTNGSRTKFLTVGIPIAPFNIANPLDLSVNFTGITSTANPGDVITLKAEVRSNLDKKTENIKYKWTITDANGNSIAADFGGHGTAVSGVFSTEDDKAITKQFITQFVMPDSPVNITFEVNDDRSVAETNMDNNKAVTSVMTLMPAPPVTDGEVILDYDVYSRDHSSHLAVMSTSFYNSGRINAEITSTTSNPSILSGYDYEDDFSGRGSSITITPWYKGLILRSGYGDIPENSCYLPNGIYPLTLAQTSKGTATVHYTIPGPPGEDGSPGSPIPCSDTNSFPVTTTNLPVTACVYNGGVVNQPYTRNEVSRTELAWTSNIISFNVYRNMYHMDIDGNRVNEKQMPGQYVRNFSDQNTASVVWSIPLTQANAYALDRRTASNRGANYQNAIFATDKEFSRVDYPIKSGYMFNPLGTYQCVVNSTVYYDITATEQEKKQTHEELVQKVINSFVYSNKLQYTTNGRDCFEFGDITNANRGGILDVQRRDNVTITTIPHTQYQSCMEGYEESNTLHSFTNYKYREYVVSDRVSRIDAQTVLTFTVQARANCYTFINMPDGQYSIAAKSLPFSFKGLTAPGVHLNDSIIVSVKGSLYDDRG